MAVGIAGAGMPAGLHACNVPVFRYALEKWPADPYRIVVYHRNGAHEAAYQLLRKSAEPDGAANYSLKSIDIAEPEGKAIAEQQGIAVFPWVEIHYPVHSQVHTPVWSGPLSLDGAGKILHSPARSRLAQALLGGDVAAWILIRSGDERKDRRARDTLKTSLERASADLRIPDAGADANGNPIVAADFRTYPVRFSLMEIGRDDPAEVLLARALLHSEPDLGLYSEPMAFPVFGRGRALYALVGEGIQEKNIRGACESMLAWCSCEVKAQSPGTDLPIAADWSQPFGGLMVKDPEPPLTGLSGFLEDRAPAETAGARRSPEAAAPGAVCRIAPGPRRAVPTGAPPDPRPRRSPLARNMLYAAGAAGAALLALSVFLTVRRGEKS